MQNEETSRKLATIRRVDAVQPIDGADRIETAVFGGWKTVVQKGQFKPGELAVYVEIDSWVPHELAPFLSQGREPKEHKGVKGAKLRTAKLRGQLSQGLALPIDVLDMIGPEGTDVTAQLGILKWEPPVNLAGGEEAKGARPWYIRKTDLERIQNMPDILDVADSYEVQIKVDGTSCTVYARNGVLGCTGRNIEWDMDSKEADRNLYVRVPKDSGLLEALAEYHAVTGMNLAIQGEIAGPGIQKNRGKYPEKQFFAFDIWDIDDQAYRSCDDRDAIFEWLEDLGWKRTEVPCVGRQIHSDWFGEMDKFLETVDSVCRFRDPPAEGLVFKSMRGDTRFKAISNSYLAKEK